MFRPYLYWPSSGSDNSLLRVQRIWLKHVEVVYNNKYKKNIVQLVGGNISYVLDFCAEDVHHNI